MVHLSYYMNVLKVYLNYYRERVNSVFELLQGTLLNVYLNYYREHINSVSE